VLMLVGVGDGVGRLFSGWIWFTCWREVRHSCHLPWLVLLVPQYVAGSRDNLTPCPTSRAPRGVSVSVNIRSKSTSDSPSSEF